MMSNRLHHEVLAHTETREATKYRSTLFCTSNKTLDTTFDCAMPLQGLALFVFSSFAGFITASVLHADSLDKQILHYAQQAYGS